jgi:hypothetical protein
MARSRLGKGVCAGDHDNDGVGPAAWSGNTSPGWNSGWTFFQLCGGCSTVLARWRCYRGSVQGSGNISNSYGRAGNNHPSGSERGFRFRPVRITPSEAAKNGVISCKCWGDTT